MAASRDQAAQRDRQENQLQRIREEADRLPQADAEPPLQPDIKPDRTRRFTHVNFSRMRTEWGPAERTKIAEITRIADQVMISVFPDALALLDRIYMKVRYPEVKAGTGEVLRGLDKRIRWRRDDDGLIIEDWSRMSDPDRNTILHELVTHMVEWRQQAATMWGSAMFAKGMWEEEFAFGYTSPPGNLTIDDRTQRGHLASMESRYFAIFQSVLSRRADALIKSLERIEAVLMKEAPWK